MKVFTYDSIMNSLPNHACMVKCPETHYYDTTKDTVAGFYCLPCSGYVIKCSKCMKESGQMIICLKCDDGFFPDPNVTNNYANTCSACDSTCKTCIGSNTNCLTCPTGKKIEFVTTSLSFICVTDSISNH